MARNEVVELMRHHTECAYRFEWFSEERELVSGLRLIHWDAEAVRHLLKN
jgi:hypothetical protein